jgi:hypothetical protein
MSRSRSHHRQENRRAHAIGLLDSDHSRRQQCDRQALGGCGDHSAEFGDDRVEAQYRYMEIFKLNNQGNSVQITQQIRSKADP